MMSIAEIYDEDVMRITLTHVARQHRDLRLAGTRRAVLPAGAPSPVPPAGMSTHSRAAALLAGQSTSSVLNTLLLCLQCCLLGAARSDLSTFDNLNNLALWPTGLGGSRQPKHHHAA